MTTGESTRKIHHMGKVTHCHFGFEGNTDQPVFGMEAASWARSQTQIRSAVLYFPCPDFGVSSQGDLHLQVLPVALARQVRSEAPMDVNCQYQQNSLRTITKATREKASERNMFTPV